MLSSQSDTDTRQAALARGAAAFVSKSEVGSQISDVVVQLLHADAPPEPVASIAPNRPYLTPRQCEVLDLMSQGLTNKTIAKKLSLSDNTVRRHLQDIFAFFGVTTRTEAVYGARQKGLLDTERS